MLSVVVCDIWVCVFVVVSSICAITLAPIHRQTKQDEMLNIVKLMSRGYTQQIACACINASLDGDTPDETGRVPTSVSQVSMMLQLYKVIRSPPALLHTHQKPHNTHLLLTTPPPPTTYMPAKTDASGTTTSMIKRWGLPRCYPIGRGPTDASSCSSRAISSRWR